MKITNKILRFYSLLAPSGKSLNFPTLVQVEPTNRCNLRCVMCPRNYFTKSTPIGDMSLYNFCKIVDQIKKHTKWMLVSGFGETFLNKDVVKMISYAKKAGMSVSTFSNFTLVSPQLAEEIVESGLDWINASLDAGSDEKYTEIRGISINNALNGIKNLVNARRELKSNKPHIRIGCTVTSYNTTELGKLVELIKGIGIDEVSFKPASFYESENKKILVGNMNSLKVEIAKAKSICQEAGITNNLDEFLESATIASEKEGAYMEGVPCYIPWGRCFIGWNGDVRPCCDFYESFISFGNVFKTDFKSIWNNDAYMRFRSTLLNGKIPHKICLTCNHYRHNLSYHRKICKLRDQIPILKILPLRKPLKA